MTISNNKMGMNDAKNVTIGLGAILGFMAIVSTPAQAVAALQPLAHPVIVPVALAIVLLSAWCWGYLITELWLPGTRRET